MTIGGNVATSKTGCASGGAGSSGRPGRFGSERCEGAAWVHFEVMGLNIDFRNLLASKSVITLKSMLKSEILRRSEIRRLLAFFPGFFQMP